MSSVTGNILKISLFGESHGKSIGMVINNLPSGITLDIDFINQELDKRKPKGKISTSRSEDDEVIFLSGVFNNVTTGAPLAFIIDNKNTKSKDYHYGEVRPGHADYTAYIKYDGFNDYRGGGHFSGRITASIVVLGAICKQILLRKNIKIGTHIAEIHNIKDDEFSLNIEKEIDELNSSYFATLNPEAKEKMLKEIEEARSNLDSVGGILETCVLNLPIGLGEPYFDSVESRLSSLLFSIGGVKGVLFGSGMDFAKNYGSQMNDQVSYIDGKIEFLTNHNGGINGGITNGDKVLFKTIIKPTPSIAKHQQSINISTKENIDLSIQGRHDPCIVHRVRSVVDALTAFCILDLMMENNAKKVIL